MRHFFLPAIVLMSVLSLKDSFAFPITVQNGDTELSIRLTYKLKPGALEAANPSVNFERFLIAGMSLEIPLVEKDELDTALERNKVLVENLGAKERELATLGERYAKLEKEQAAVMAKRDILQPIADSARRYKVCASILFVLLVGAGFLLLYFHRRRSLLLRDLGVLQAERRDYEANIRGLKMAHAQELLNLQKKLGPSRPKLKVVPGSPKE